jgi:metal-dependent amidase/aminoacylase/carboxypeptidase family protein
LPWGMKPSLKGTGRRCEEEVVSLRRHLRCYPELSGEEYATSRTIRQKLEENDHDFVSENEGVMHACGHDVHAAMLVGAGRLLNGIREELRDCVLHVFQPAEEASPTGGADDESCGSRSFNWASRLTEHALRVRPKLVCGVS